MPETLVLEHAGLEYATDFRYTDRTSKARYIALKYGPILHGDVLDVGCDQAPLRGLVADPTRYVGVDRAAPADFCVDLDRRRLPFEDGSFDTVICTDVLEHLERAHAVLDDLCRVSRDRVLVSLPNPFANFIAWIYTGRTAKFRFYGMPADEPDDRHRWFFGHEQAKRFLTERAARNGFEVEQMDAEVSPAPVWRDERGENRLDHPDFRCGTLWCLLRRRAEG